MSSTTHRARGSSLLPALVLGTLILICWQLVVALGGIKAYLLPAPTAIASALWSTAPELFQAVIPTGTAVLGAIVIGGATGVALSIVVSLFERFARVVLVLVALASCAPIIALAPIFNAWFGVISLVSKIAVASVAVAIPVIVSTTRGLLAVEPLHREVMVSISSTRIQLMRFVRLPGALPALVDGLRVGTTMAVITVIVAEYFGGTAQALGVLIANSAAVSHFDETWAGVVVASLLGIVLYGLVDAAGRALTQRRLHGPG